MDDQCFADFLIYCVELALIFIYSYLGNKRNNLNLKIDELLEIKKIK